jgi:HK97 family phage major capsid protein
MPGLVGNVDIPRQSAAATGEWLPEDGPITTSDLSFESVTLIPKSVGAMLSWSRRMFLNANPDIESVCRADLAAVIGLAVDKGALHGIGTSNQPDGLYHHAGVSVLAFGGLPTYAKLLAMVEDLAISNALRGQLAFVTTPQIAGLLSRTLVASAAGSEMVWTGSLLEGRICGFPAFATNQVSSTLEAGAEHGLIFGNFADLLIGQWGSSVDILVDPYTDADRGRVRITAFADLDVALRHPESFCKATGLTIV